MRQRPIKFKFFCVPAKGFIENYKYNGKVDDLFNGEDPLLIPLQYTGENDELGKEIWEGDKVEVQFFKWHTQPVFTGVIEYNNGGFCVKIVNAKGTLSLIWFHQLKEGEAKIKVLGNVLENSNTRNIMNKKL